MFVSLGKHRPSLTWKPYRDIVANGVDWKRPYIALETLLGRQHSIILRRIGVASSQSNFSQTHEHSYPVTDLYSFSVPQHILAEMLQTVKFRHHPRNKKKLTYIHSTSGQQGAIGRTGDSQEEVCQIIWDEFHATWKDRVSLRK